MAKDKNSKYYTLPLCAKDSYESKCIRNNAPFETGFIRERNKEPNRYMVYPVEGEVVRYYLAEHTLRDTESMSGYSRYNMECKPLYEVELVSSVKGSPYAMYRIKQDAKKRPTRKIKLNKYPITKLIL